MWWLNLIIDSDFLLHCFWVHSNVISGFVTKENLIWSNNTMKLQRMLLKERYLMSSLKLLINMKINMKEKDKRNEFLMSHWICNSSFDSTQAEVTRKKRIFGYTICSNFHGSVVSVKSAVSYSKLSPAACECCNNYWHQTDSEQYSKGCSLIFPWMNFYFYLLVFYCTFYKMKLTDKIEPQHNNT